MLMPILQRPRQAQVAALCYQQTKSGKRVLLITSRGTGRWILPKGWPIEGKDGPGSALQEAWEEAGVAEARMDPAPLGSYRYDKGLKDGEHIPIETTVYQAQVDSLEPTYPEAHQRSRKWFPPQEAAELVDEPQLKAILKAF